MEDESRIDRRILGDTDFPAGPPGAENDLFEPMKKHAPSTGKESSSRSKRRDSRSKSPSSRRRRRSRSTSSPDRRRRRYDDRGRGRRSRSRDRPRSPPPSRSRRNRSKSNSRERFRSRRSRSGSRPSRRNWSPNKKGPVSPPPIQQQVNAPPPPSFNMPPMQMYNDGYNNYPPQNMSFGQPPQQYSNYEYPIQVPAQNTFTAYPPPPVMQPVPPGDDFQQAQPPWNAPPPQIAPPQMIVPPKPVSVMPTESDEEKQKRDAAVALEKKNQRATLRKQREDYKRRSTALKRELITLKEQRSDLKSGSEPLSPTTKGFLKENDRLQLQIENKISTIENVIDMLTGIIGNEKSPSPQPLPAAAVAAPASSQSSSRKSKKKSSKSDDDSSPERLKTKVLESIKKNKGDSKHREVLAETKPDENKMNVKYTFNSDLEKLEEPIKPIKKINYVHYDPEMHWCKICKVFPKTAKDYLTHLHTKEHQEMQKSVESPWHDKPLNDEMPNYPDGQTKRTPIRGLQFFIQTSGWYCKLCSVWMGDLHCASLHLKSQTHANQYNEYTVQNPHFEIDWMSDRQKAYETKREHELVPPQPPLMSESSSIGLSATGVLDGIPLQIQLPNHKVPTITTTTTELDDKKKKKKKKQDEKKEKKKKKRSKKRKHSSSSSSSSDSSDSDTDAGDKNKEDTSHSIRVAMRNLLKQQTEKKLLEESGGKWTVVQPAQIADPAPPPPTISANGADTNRRDELMISQWNAPQPIITEKEKKLLEDLKGRVKGRSVDQDTNGRGRKSREPSRERRRSRSRSRDRDRRGGGRRSRSRGRRSRSTSRNRSPGRWGSSRRRSRSRSRSRRIEKPIVRYPEFRPRVPEKEKDKKKSSKYDDDGNEKKTTLTFKKTTTAAKKLPFIGRMPVFKKQTNDEELAAAKKEELNQQEQNTEVYAPSSYPYDNMQPMAPEDYDDLMPDPMQFVSLMGAPPPPPMVPPPVLIDKNEPVLPPGIDEADADLVTKPISDAPLPRKGPLPQDFQDALSIIFPGEKKPESEQQQPPPQQQQQQVSIAEKPEISYAIENAKPVELEQILMPTSDDHSQQSLDMYTAYAVPDFSNGQVNPDLQFAEDVDIPVSLPPPPPPKPADEVSDVVDQKVLAATSEEEKKSARMDELDDLAMLGIDADDLAAQQM